MLDHEDIYLDVKKKQKKFHSILYEISSTHIYNQNKINSDVISFKPSASKIIFCK